LVRERSRIGAVDGPMRREDKDRHRRLLESLLPAATVVLCLSAAVRGQLTHGKPVELPRPSVSANNPARLVPMPPGLTPHAPPGFTVSVLASGFEEPRWLAVAPNDDVFVADSASGTIVVLHDPLHRGPREVFADHLSLPFGIAFHERFVYVAEGSTVDRFPYDPRTAKRTGEKQPVLAVPPVAEPNAPGVYGHSTRSLGFSLDGHRLFVSIGAATNVSLDDDPARAVVIVCDLDGTHRRVYASGLRNAIGLAVHPHSGRVWATVNERGGLGDDLPPDYFTEVRERGFYGFPFKLRWRAPRHAGVTATPRNGVERRRA